MAVCPSCGLPTPHNGPCPSSHSLSTGLPVLQGRYEVVHLLGQGGMGTVFMARDLRLQGRDCVVKKLRDDFYREEDRQKAQAFFEREAGVLSRLQHPNIVHILDYFRENDDYYLVMEHVKGHDLHYILQDRGEPFDEDQQVIPWAIQICDVLNYLHSENVIYRDLKPSNIMIDLKGQVKLVDFGIARAWEDAGENTHVVSAGYSPPEQYWGAATPQSDIYALGATMHYLLTGKDPEALHASSPKASNEAVSNYTDQLVQRATAQDMSQRFQTVEEMREALLEKDYVPAPETPRSRVGEIVVGVVLFVVACLLYLGPQVLEPLLPKSIKQSLPPQILSGERDYPEGPPSQGLLKPPPPKPVQKDPLTQRNVSNADLTVQVMDEKELTDPSGASETGETQNKLFGGITLPWSRPIDGNK